MRRAPLTIFLISGIFPIVPGAGIYYTGYHIFMNDNAAALATGMETIKIAIAIAIAIGIVVSLPPFSSRSGGRTRKETPLETGYHHAERR